MLVLLLLLSISLTACDNKQKGGDMNNDANNPKVQEGAPFVFSMATRAGENYKATPVFEEWMEKTNVDVEMLQKVIAAYDEWFVLASAAGDLTDVVNQPTDALSIRLMAEGGKGFIELTELIDEYAPHYKAQLLKEPELYRNVKSDNGKLYTMVKIQKPALSKSEAINYTFLEQLNMQNNVPTNVDELLTYFRKVKSSLSSANPKIYPYGQARSVANDKLTQPTYHWFHLMENWYYDGEKYNHALYTKTDISKQMFRWLNTIYSEGLCPPDFLTVDDTTARGRAQNNELGFFYTYVAQAANLNPTYTRGRNDYRLIPPIKGPGGAAAFSGRQFPGAGGTFYISDTCKEPEKVVKALDYWYTDEGIALSNWGPEEYRAKDAKGNWTYGPKFYEEAGGKGPSDPNFNASKTTSKLGIIQTMFTNVTLKERQYAVSHPSIQDYEKWAQPYYIPWQPVFSLTPEEQMEINAINTEIESKLAGIAPEDFITGKRTFDAWDIYATTFNNSGGERLLEIYNTALARWKKR